MRGSSATSSTYGASRPPGATVVVGAGGKATLKLKVPKKAKKAAAGALKAGKKVKAKVIVVVADTSGNKRTVKVTVKLKK